MEFQVVLKMSAYWDIEPPLEWAYSAIHFKQKEETKANATNVIPGTGVTSWNKLPVHIQNDIIKDFCRLNPGKTEDDFHKDRQAKVKQRYAKDLEKARQAKAK